MKSEFFKISDWLKANKSINIEEINFILCHNYRAKKNLTLKISLIFIDSLEIKQVTCPNSLQSKLIKTYLKTLALHLKRNQRNFQKLK